MIKLQHGYAIETSNGIALTLVKYGVGESKDGEIIQTKVNIGYYTTLESALQAYSNNVVIDAVSDFELDLKAVKEIIQELKEEIKQYEV